VEKEIFSFSPPAMDLFAISIVSGDKAVSVVQESKMPKERIQKLVTAKRSMEGRGIRTEVKSRRSLKHIIRLVDIKVAN